MTISKLWEWEPVSGPERAFSLFKIWMEDENLMSSPITVENVLPPMSFTSKISVINLLSFCLSSIYIEQHEQKPVCRFLPFRYHLTQRLATIIYKGEKDR